MAICYLLLFPSGIVMAKFGNKINDRELLLTAHKSFYFKFQTSLRLGHLKLGIGDMFVNRDRLIRLLESSPTAFLKVAVVKLHLATFLPTSHHIPTHR
jgi:hypothetical protein